MLRAWKDFDLTATVNCFRVCLKSEISLSQEPEKLFKYKALTAADDSPHRKRSVCQTRCRRQGWMEPRSKWSIFFWALAMPAVDVGFALPSSGQDIFIPPIATVVVRKKAGLTCVQECGNCNYIVRRLCVGHCTVKCNCTSQLTQLSTALPSPFSQGPFAQEQIHSPLPCLAATLLFPFLITKWLGLALLLVRAMTGGSQEE